MKHKKVTPKTPKGAVSMPLPIKTEPLTGNCSLCASDDSPAYECPKFIYDELENTFNCSINFSDKNEFRICVTCSYHISILSKFVNMNICISGMTPLCFMCKNFAVFDIQPNELKSQLKNTPFGTQIEDNANYFACVVCLYQLMKYQNYKTMIDNFQNGSGHVTTSTNKIKKLEQKNQNAATPGTSRRNGPTVLLQKLDLSKFKLTPFILLKSGTDDNDEDDDEDDVVVTSTKPGRKRSRSDSIYTEALPKKRRYAPLSTSSSESSEADKSDSDSDAFPPRSGKQKSGKRVTINTRPSVMKTTPPASKTPMKSALKTPTKTTPKTTAIKTTAKSPKVESTKKSGKQSPKIQIKLPSRAAKSPKAETPIKSPQENSTTRKKRANPTTPAKTKTASKLPRTPTKPSSPEPVTVVESDSNETSDKDEPELKSSRQPKKTPIRKLPMKTPAEKKQMIMEEKNDRESKDEDDTNQESSEVEDASKTQKSESVKETKKNSDAEGQNKNILDLTNDHDDAVAEIITRPDSEDMEQMAVDDDSEYNEESVKKSNANKENVDNMEKESSSVAAEKSESVEKEKKGKVSSSVKINSEENTAITGDDDDDDDVDDAATMNKKSMDGDADDAMSVITEFIISDSKLETAVASSTAKPTNGNSNSDKENTIDLLKDDSNSSEFGVIKKLNNNERVQLDINMDKIFDELKN